MVTVYYRSRLHFRCTCRLQYSEAGYLLDVSYSIEAGCMYTLVVGYGVEVCYTLDVGYSIEV